MPFCAALTGELALAVPCLGASQQLLNKDHRQAYYEGMPQIPGGRWAGCEHDWLVQCMCSHSDNAWPPC